jgi:hypothetical protein
VLLPEPPPQPAAPASDATRSSDVGKMSRGRVRKLSSRTASRAVKHEELSRRAVQSVLDG